MVEHQPSKLSVAGSSLAFRSRQVRFDSCRDSQRTTPATHPIELRTQAGYFKNTSSSSKERAAVVDTQGSKLM
jgi:hypothetical protein